MDSFWKQSPGPQNSTSITVAQTLKEARAALSTPASFIYVIAEVPYLASDNVQDMASDRSFLQEQNQQMKKMLATQSLQVQRSEALKSENDRLRELLGSRKKLPGNAIIAEIIGSVPNPYTHQVIIDKGGADGIVDGLGVVDAQGLFGQVVSVGKYSSRVLLLIDRDHAVPARINRTGTRLIVGGTGEQETLLLENVPISTDVVIGDLIETSGFGGRFPDGYPLGLVYSVSNGSGLTYAQVELRPSARLNSAGHVLVIMPNQDPHNFMQRSAKLAVDEVFAQ